MLRCLLREDSEESDGDDSEFEVCFDILEIEFTLLPSFLKLSAPEGQEGDSSDRSNLGALDVIELMCN